MTDRKTVIRQELEGLLKEADTLMDLASPKGSSDKFGAAYQQWYTRALRVVERLAPDRLDEFIAYYRRDPKREILNALNYVLQDFVMGLQAPENFSYKPAFDIKKTAALKLLNQQQILASVDSRIDGALADLESYLYGGIQDAELEEAAKLKSVNLRAAGALARVVLEEHLQKVSAAHGVKVGKKDPTISDLNDPLRSQEVYDTPTWRKIQFLADIGNMCTHKKSADPTTEQVDELISGVRGIIKTVF